ncbi:MAG TPA: 50S ribosomal protein L21 [Candidatus Cloacimonas sp.]|jgi:large subunit ribosomal protein L21|nr:large subunit ribosomal protein [Candidatus Cloacimonadota bacterium]HCX73355.1 50S ribosomal protein L21 [Candidatus Cloacimonas sp.]
MYAIVDFKGTQLKVEPEQTVQVAYLGDKEAGAQVEMNKVLLIDDDGKTEIGQPNVENAKVIAEVLAHKKDKKVIVFKKKRRKGYQKKQGHRQNYTELKIKEISR